MKKPTYNKSRTFLMNYLLSFCTIKEHNIVLGLNNSDRQHSFTYASWGDKPLIPGDLVLLGSVSMYTKYMLSWFIESRKLPNNDTEYLLKSTEDWATCWWSNVSISYFSRETVAKFPMWQWDDDQHAFQSKWDKAVAQTHGKPRNCVFNEDGSVICTTRAYFGNEIVDEFKVENWKKITLTYLKSLLKK